MVNPPIQKDLKPKAIQSCQGLVEACCYPSRPYSLLKKWDGQEPDCQSSPCTGTSSLVYIQKDNLS